MIITTRTDTDHDSKATLFDKKKIEAYGIKGMKNTKWRKVFKSGVTMIAWAEKNDAEIQGTRKV